MLTAEGNGMMTAMVNVNSRGQWDDDSHGQRQQQKAMQR